MAPSKPKAKPTVNAAVKWQQLSAAAVLEMSQNLKVLEQRVAALEARPVSDRT
jgi:hypothetical protein